MKKKQPCFAAIWSHEPENEQSNHEYCLVSLLASDKVVPGHIIVHSAVANRWNTPPLSFCKLRVVSTDPLPIQKIVLSIAEQDGSGITHDADQIRRCFHEWLTHRRDPVALMNNSDIELPDNNRLVQCRIGLQFPDRFDDNSGTVLELPQFVHTYAVSQTKRLN